MDPFVTNGILTVWWELQLHFCFYIILLLATYFAFHPKELRQRRGSAVFLTLAISCGLLPLLWMQAFRYLFPGPSTRGAVHFLGFVVLAQVWSPVWEWSLDRLRHRKDKSPRSASSQQRKRKPESIRLKF